MLFLLVCSLQQKQQVMSVDECGHPEARALHATEERRWGRKSDGNAYCISLNESLNQPLWANEYEVGHNGWQKFIQHYLLTFIHYWEINQPWERGTKKIFCETLAPICHCELPESKLQLLPSSSSSDVIDFERIDRAVVGALFGGGGAEQRETDMWPKAGRSSAVIWRRHTFSGKSLIDQSNFTEGKGSN